jgi:16S rRNA (cytidine1402-2'-O)-methyltransferase
VPSLAHALRHAAAFAAGAQQYPAGTLYVVATPIGNLADLSLRAIHVLGLVDVVACEDTRVSGGLLHRLGLSPDLVAVHEHNEQRVAQELVARLHGGARIAYISDAGTPAVSDPGARLVAAVRQAGLRVVPVPGPSAVAAALSVVGDIGAAQSEVAYTFAGFLPAKGRVRQERMAAWAARPETLVLFEAPHRIEDLAVALAAQCPDRLVSLCRELTKQFEQIHTAPCADLPCWLAADPQHRRGEFVVVLHAMPAQDAGIDDGLAPDIETLLRALLSALPLKQAVAVCAQVSGASRNALYQQALAWKADGPDAVAADEED